MIRVGSSLLLLFLVALPAPAAQLPPGFVESEVASGFTGATAMDFAPDGRLFLCEQTGALRVVKNGALLPEPFLTVEVDSSWERGLLGVAFDPDFAHNHYVYVNYTPAKPYAHHRISRFTARGDRAVSGSEVILFEGDNQDALGGGVKNGHQGGAIHFGKDGKLYVAIGDQTAGAPAQDLHTLQGKILRLERDGSIPTDNPFYRQTTGKYRAIWALGLRNPFTFAFQPGTGRMFINDVGGANEEVNEGFAGANYGWPTADHGPTKDRRFRGPIHWYRESSIAGGAFYNPPVRQFPERYVGKYFFADFKQGWIHVLDPDHPERVSDFLSGLGNFSIVDLKVADDGSLYYLRRLAWVKDHEFRPRTGVLYRIRYTGADAPPSLDQQPASQAAPTGTAVCFQVRAAGGKPLRYQWQRDGRDIVGAASPHYLIAAVSRADDGANFRCIVTNPHGRRVSEPATLTVTPSIDELAAHETPGLSVSPAPGVWTGPVSVRITPTVSDAQIHYTTDDTAPTPKSPRWQNLQTFRHSTTIRLALVREGKPVGAPQKMVYTLRGDTPYGLPHRLPTPALEVPPIPEKLPPLLSQTGLFSSLVELRPRPELVPYDVQAPLWSDGAAKRRWLLPGRGPIGFSPAGEWSFPAGTLFVKHFELAVDKEHPERKRRLETRLLVVDGTGNGYGATYKWRPDSRDADLLPDSLSEDVVIQTARGPRKQTWYYPSRADCLACHTPAAKFVLGVKTRQLNGSFTYPTTGVRDNQLRTWNHLGLFRSPLDESQIAGLARLSPPGEEQAPLEKRARSYLDANCAHCHRPGNLIRATFDARFDTPLERQGLLDAATVSDSLGLRDPRVIACGDPARSMVLERMRRGDKFHMPPLATNVRDEAAVKVLEAWIRKGPRGR
jgi:uncharacterized repeat protein (TIGR03806 family)